LDFDGIPDADYTAVQTQTLGAKKVLLKDRDGDAAKRKLIMILKDLALVVPSIGGEADPTVVGALLVLHNPLTLQTDSYALPASAWSGIGNPPGIKGYKYKDKILEHGPCKSVTLKGKLVKASCKGDQIAFALSGAPQGSIAAALEAGAARYCVTFTGAELTVDVPDANGGNGVVKGKGTDAGVCPLR
jgi:hypothetical protein